VGGGERGGAGGACSFRTAARLVERFTGVRIGASTARRTALATGATMRALEMAEATTVRETGGMEPRSPDVPLHVSMDGSLIRLRDDGWREGKLLAIGERSPDGGSLTHLSYAATLGPAEAFADASLAELDRRGIPQATDLVAVNDGAVWIQEVLDLSCPQAHRVLDFAHAAGYLAAVANATWDDADTVRTWFADQRHVLLAGDPDQVVAALATMPASEERDTAFAYLTTRRAQIAYRDFTARGWPIGSGCVERAHQHVIQDRLKGRGMGWSREGATAMLELRVVEANQRWDATWRRVGPSQRATRRSQAAERRAARARQFRVLKPRPAMVANGKPTAHHPWKRGLARRSASPTTM
jgi:hypothetical protein